MTIFCAMSLADGRPFYYEAIAPEEQVGYTPPSEHTIEHAPEVVGATTTPGPRKLTKKQFADRFTAAEFRATMDAVATVKEVRDWWMKFLLLTPDPDSTSIDLDSTDAHIAVVTVFYALEQIGTVATDQTEIRVMEVLS